MSVYIVILDDCGHESIMKVLDSEEKAIEFIKNAAKKRMEKNPYLHLDPESLKHGFYTFDDDVSYDYLEFEVN